MPIKIDSSTTITTQQNQEAKKIIDQMLDQNLETLMNKYMIPEVKSAARAANVPKGFVDNIKFIRTGDNEGEIINTWGSEELPLALWFNYGTVDHGSLGPWPLHWKSKSTGKDIYAQFVRGVPKTLAMEIGIELGTKRLKLEIPKYVEDRLV